MKRFIVLISTIFLIFTAFLFSYLSPVRAASPQLLIHAINPGFSIDGKANSGEFIELVNLSGTSLSLTGVSIWYTNTSGTRSLLYQFPAASQMIGETLLLRLASSPQAELADTTYSKTLALGAGPLELAYNDTVFDSLCWTGQEGCYAKFSSSNPSSLVRDLEAENFEFQTDYEPTYRPEQPSLQLPPPTDETISPQCHGLQFSELLSFYEADKTEQFIELYNNSSNKIDLNGCSLLYRRHHYPLSGAIQPDQYLARHPSDLGFALTKNPTNSNQLKLIDTDGSTVDSLTYWHGQKPAVAYAQFDHDGNGREQWSQTYQPTPNQPNQFQAFRSCPAGKTINVATGNCIKINTLTTKPCPAGQYRNPLTGRCKSRHSKQSQRKPCPKGYERNPETHRCRKIRQNTGASFPLSTQSFEQKSAFIALSVLALLAALGLSYVFWQFRREIAYFFRHPLYCLRRLLAKLLQISHQVKQKLFSNRGKKSN